MFQNQGVNKVILVGQVEGRPEWKTIAGNKCLCLKLITIENINRQGAVCKHAENHFIQIAESVVDNAASLQDGTELYLEGKITTRPSIDHKGIKRYDTAIIAHKYNIMAKAPAPVLNVM
ncbi:single-stranded DNA-binding protein [Mucilaginibacter phyllosphaerae]|uniref:Single-stranded DNA-binding protein n=1 Tax=Mucilaginibacter phyllosphaerae TaxID=1812349 RepID=A0A4Y8AIM9_9SPHI|nr:single-stranded DNA-binding protein [Mucilaginibacter phyllosphaerae]MBB3968053.1 single-stranded DNA-binding protein [Mucilaginibacter phyllosphaerae]TEW68924.1 hypothetical protein E2R65_01810 [Mucilaginibacter phyllosphaerae]GGH01527.1 hypothetical protein GCM10007352_03360 [Mucilaginibacter phyllosphaerae]